MATTSVVFDLIARDRASDKFDKFGRSVDGSSSKMSKLSGAMKSVAKVGAIGLAVGVGLAGKALFDATKMAIADEAAQALLANTLRRTAGATDRQVEQTERWITAQGKALGVTDDELRPALQRLAEATGDVGEAQKLAAIAMDASAGTGKSLKTVSEALMKAQNGNVGALSRLGIETKNAKGETLTFEEATRKMADTFGGAAATKADTLEGKVGRLKLMFDETREAIGAKLIPVVTELADWFMDKALPAIQKFGDEMRDRLQPTFEVVAAWVTDKLVPGIVGLVDQFRDNFLPIIERVVGWVMDKLVPALMRFAEDVMPAVRGVIDNVRDALKNAQPFFELLGNIVVNVLIPFLGKLAKTVLPILGDALKLVGKALGKVGELGKWMWNNALQPVFKFFVEAIGKVLQWFGKMLQVIGKVPKMGWVGDLGDKLVRTGEDADEMGDKIKKIPDSHNTKITMDATQANITLGQLEVRLDNLADHLQGMFNGSSGGSGRATTNGPIGAGGIWAAAPPPGSGPGGISSNRGLTININMGVGDPVAVGKQVEQILVKYGRTVGRPLQVRTIT